MAILLIILDFLKIYGKAYKSLKKLKKKYKLNLFIHSLLNLKKTNKLPFHFSFLIHQKNLINGLKKKNYIIFY